MYAHAVANQTNSHREEKYILVNDDFIENITRIMGADIKVPWIRYDMPIIRLGIPRTLFIIASFVWSIDWSLLSHKTIEPNSRSTKCFVLCSEVTQSVEKR